jgi:hypothetical protein
MRACFLLILSLACARPADVPSPAPRAVDVRGVFGPLVHDGKWTLVRHDLKEAHPSDRVVIEVRDVRELPGGVRVAHLRYTWESERYGVQEAGDGEHLPRTVAVTTDGAWFLPSWAGDDELVVKLVRTSTPRFVDPPKRVRATEEDGYRFVDPVLGPRGAMVCIGHERPPGEGCEHTCFGQVCFSPEAGIVSISGTEAPGFGHYAQPGWE